MRKSVAAVATAGLVAGALAAGAGAASAAPLKPVLSGPHTATAPDAAAGQASRYATSHGALGAYFDAASGHTVVVEGPSGHLRAAAVGRSVGAPVRVERRSISKATVAEIQRRIAGRAFSPAAKRYSYASYLDLKTGRVVLNTDAPASVTAPLSTRYLGLIDRHHEAVSDSFDRRNDTAPFWGGASIKGGGAVCTAGFVVQRSGVRYMTTAGHCFSVGTSVTTTDGNLGMGTVVQRGPFTWFNNWDMELIGGSSYGTSIYVGGTSSSTGRHVNGAGDPVVGFTNYCRSGQTSGEQCGETVQSVSAQVCTQTGCKSPVIAYTGPLSQPGDSGAPFYVYSVDGTQVYIRGMNIAVGGSTSYAEKWSRISSNLGVSIVT